MGELASSPKSQTLKTFHLKEEETESVDGSVDTAELEMIFVFPYLDPHGFHPEDLHAVYPDLVGLSQHPRGLCLYPDPCPWSRNETRMNYQNNNFFDTSNTIIDIGN